MSQTNDELKNEFEKLHHLLKISESKIISELTGMQGKKVDLQGYYSTDKQKTEIIMRPSSTLNSIINTH